MENNKDSTWYILAAIASFFVVWGHHFGHLANRYIFSFHVPLLFFLAGLIHPNQFKAQFKSYVIFQIKQILLPYFLYSIILYIIWFALFYMTGKAEENGLSACKNFIGIFYAQGMNEYMDWGMQMWLFPCLFLTRLIAYPVIKLEMNKLLFWSIATVFFVAGIMSNKIIKEPLPWCFDASLIGLVFYLAGYLVSNKELSENRKIGLVLFIVLFSIGILLQYINTSRIDLKLHWYGNYLLFAVSAFSSIAAYYCFSKSFSNIKYITWPGRFILPVYIFHLRIWTFINVILQKMWPGISRTGIIETLLFSIVQFTSIIILTIIYDKVKTQLTQKNKNKISSFYN